MSKSLVSIIFIFLSCTARLPNIEGVWITDISKSNPESYSELVFGKDSVRVFTPYRGDFIEKFYFVHESNLQIGYDRYKFNMISKDKFWLEIDSNKTWMIKSPIFPIESSYNERYFIVQVNQIDSLSQEQKDSLIHQFKIGSYPKLLGPSEEILQNGNN